MKAAGGARAGQQIRCARPSGSAMRWTLAAPVELETASTCFEEVPRHEAGIVPLQVERLRDPLRWRRERLPAPPAGLVDRSLGGRGRAARPGVRRNVRDRRRGGNWRPERPEHRPRRDDRRGRPERHWWIQPWTKPSWLGSKQMLIPAGSKRTKHAWSFDPTPYVGRQAPRPVVGVHAHAHAGQERAARDPPRRRHEGPGCVHRGSDVAALPRDPLDWRGAVRALGFSVEVPVRRVPSGLLSSPSTHARLRLEEEP